jgi:hypothetical protein
MESNHASRSNPLRGRAAWAVSGVAFVLVAVAGWWLSRPADVPRSTVATPAPSAPGTLGSLGFEVKAEAVTRPLPAASTAVPEPVAPTAAVDELRKVQRALEGPATPKEKLEAATIIAACQNADVLVQSVYTLRDQRDPKWQMLEKSSGISSEEQIKMLQGYQRSCQAFDAATLARRGELLKGAYEGGAKGSALPYLLWLSGSWQEVDPALRSKLQREARQPVEDGDLAALAQYSMVVSPTTLGITEVQRRAYKEAWLRVQGEMNGAAMELVSRASADNFEKSMAKMGILPPPLTPEQQHEADALTAKVVDAWRRRQSQGG